MFKTKDRLEKLEKEVAELKNRYRKLQLDIKIFESDRQVTAEKIIEIAKEFMTRRNKYGNEICFVLEST